MAARDREVQARIAIIVKDLTTVMDEAKRLGSALPMTGLATELHKLLARRVLADADNAEIIQLYTPD